MDMTPDYVRKAQDEIALRRAERFRKCEQERLDAEARRDAKYKEDAHNEQAILYIFVGIVIALTIVGLLS